MSLYNNIFSQKNIIIFLFVIIIVLMLFKSPEHFLLQNPVITNSLPSVTNSLPSVTNSLPSVSSSENTAKIYDNLTKQIDEKHQITFKEIYNMHHKFEKQIHHTEADIKILKNDVKNLYQLLNHSKNLLDENTHETHKIHHKLNKHEDHINSYLSNSVNDMQSTGEVHNHHAMQSTLPVQNYYNTQSTGEVDNHHAMQSTLPVQNYHNTQSTGEVHNHHAMQSTGSVDNYYAMQSTVQNYHNAQSTDSNQNHTPIANLEEVKIKITNPDGTIIQYQDDIIKTQNMDIKYQIIPDSHNYSIDGNYTYSQIPVNNIIYPFSSN
jgi:hypothetical protein